MACAGKELPRRCRLAAEGQVDAGASAGHAAVAFACACGKGPRGRGGHTEHARQPTHYLHGYVPDVNKPIPHTDVLIPTIMPALTTTDKVLSSHHMSQLQGVRCSGRGLALKSQSFLGTSMLITNAGCMQDGTSAPCAPPGAALLESIGVTSVHSKLATLHANKMNL
jgi:hypothetical protein